MSTIAELFRKVIESPPGTTCLVKRTTSAEADRIRVAIHRERVKLTKFNPTLAEKVIISKKGIQESNLFEVTITLTDSVAVAEATFVYPDGETEIWRPEASESREMRMRELMEEDGFSKEEIDSYMKGGI